LLVSAPEKVAGENVGVAADIWGVGVLAFILLVSFHSQMKNIGLVANVLLG
jgi:hypothetical protein